MMELIINLALKLTASAGLSSPTVPGPLPQFKIHVPAAGHARISSRTYACTKQGNRDGVKHLQTQLSGRLPMLLIIHSL